MANVEYKVPGFVTYAKVFKENRDMGKMHEKTDGAYVMNFYYKDEADVKALKDGGVPLEQLGWKVFREDENPDAPGIGIWTKLKRPHNGPFITDDGEDIFGGPPKIYDYTNGPSSKLWEYNEGEGELGNGTEVIAIIQHWKTARGQGLRLEQLAVVDHVPYDGASGGQSMSLAVEA